MTVRVVLADDHTVVRAGLRRMLESEPDIQIAGEACDGIEVVELAGRLQPDLVLMDLRMPQIDGATATSRIRERHPDVHVLVLTTYDTDADILRAVEAGATGYLLKDATRDDLLRAVRSAAAGHSVLAPTVAARLLGRVGKPAPDALTAREIEVLELAAKGRVNKRIAKELHVSEATVKSHLVHIFAKLGVEDRTEAVAVAMDRGILRLER